MLTASSGAPKSGWRSERPQRTRRREHGRPGKAARFAGVTSSVHSFLGHSRCPGCLPFDVGSGGRLDRESEDEGRDVKPREPRDKRRAGTSHDRPEFDRSKSLDELEPPAWGPPAFDSYLVTTCHRLRRKPVAEFTTEDLRIMIGQQIGLQWLVPLALEVLKSDPLAHGDYYPGDLLSSVLLVDSTFWSRHAKWRALVEAVLDEVHQLPDELVQAAETFRSAK